MRKAIGVFGSILLTVVLWAGSVIAAEQVFFYHTDPAGTPLAMTDSTGKVVWKTDNKPFGEEQSVTQTIPNNKRFVGKEKDVETGLNYFDARYLNNKIGRFIAPDQVGPVNPWNSKTNEEMLLNPQKINKYAYALNNPYRYTDPNGKEPISIAILANVFLPSSANAPEYRYSPTARSQSAAEFAGGVALMEAGGRIPGSISGTIGVETGVPVARSLGAAAANDAKVLQTGGHTISRRVLKELGLNKGQAKNAMEGLKRDNTLSNNFHETKIWSNGDVSHSQTGKVLGNLHNYVP